MQTISLNQQLEDARKAYYAGEPIMSDAEYDILEQQLAGLNSHAPASVPPPSVLTTVGTDAPGRIPHASPMRSIENVYSIDEAVAWAESLGWPKLSLSGKFDGISASLTYERGEIVKAVTRGDGEAGESILSQVLACSSIPNHLGEEVSLEIRGELVIARSTMEGLNETIAANGGKPYVSTRNLVAGTMKLKDLAEVTKRRVKFVPWEVLADYLDQAGDLYDSASTRLTALTDIGFDIPPIYRVGQANFVEALTNFIELVLNEKDPEIALDGIVIKVDSCSLRRELGMGSKFANFQRAFKAQNAKTETTLLDVIWQVGRQGRLTPVGIVEPVVLAGATIERVMLNNLSWIQEMGLKIGSRVMLMRSGDVIPKIVEVLDA